MATKSLSIVGTVTACLAFACGSEEGERGAESSGGSSGTLAHYPPLETRPVAGGAALDEGLSFGAGVSVENLTVWPVFADAIEDVGEYLTLGDAVKAGLATVREQDSASVDSILVENRATQPILACSGTVVKGGNQDRQIGIDTVILAGETRSVRAFCVEPGRWNARRSGVATDGVFQPAVEMAAKRVRASAQYDEDQQEVWDQTALLANAVYEVGPTSGGLPTSAYYLGSTVEFSGLAGSTVDLGTHAAVLEHADDATRAMRRRMAAAVEDHFEALPGERLVGFAYAIDGEPIAARTFATPKLFTSRLDSFLSTMCFEAELAGRRDSKAGRDVHREPASLDALLAMVRGIEASPLGAEESSDSLRVEKRANGWGGNSVCSVRSPEPSGERWMTLTRDWTAPVTFGAEALHGLGYLGALGYSGGDE